jgi:uncharacterized protein
VSAPAAVAWQPWAASTFERARAERKPILVNVAASWCHWCHVMDDETFARGDVARVLSHDFVAIRVDADARPDLAERYAEWGWPATAILTPDAQPVTELRGHQDAQPFLGLLNAVADDARAGRLQGRRAPPRPKPSRDGLAALRDAVQARLDSHYDARIGGWGASQKYPFAGPVEHSLVRAARGEDGWLDAATITLDATRKLIDPVWGGVWQYSVEDGWDTPHFEKIAPIQAGCLDNFAHAYAVTGRFLKAARAVRDYLGGFLANPDGTFGTSQDADVVRPGQATILGGDYWQLDDAHRRAVGLPRTDRAAYADWNGLLIAALCRLHDAAGDDKALAMATAAARSLLRTHRTPDGGFRHGADDATGLLHLRDNAAMGRALLALHQSTGDDAWLDAAVPVARFLLALEHPDGGFLAQTRDPAAAGALAEPRRPLEENGLAIRFLVELGWRRPDGDGAHASLAKAGRQAAERAARALASPELVAAEGRIIGQFLLGLEWLLLEPVHIDVAGPRDDAAVRALRAAALALDLPGKTVRWSRPGDGRPDRPALYACQGEACSAPITDGEQLPRAVARLATQG